MIDRIDGPLVPFRQAEPPTRAAYLAGLHDLRGLDGSPDEWMCTVCSETVSGDDVLISYNVPTPIPFCATSTCGGYGPALVPARAA